jgi:cytochrome c peroxidase
VTSGEPVAVAYTKSGNLIVQTREPSQLVSPISYNTYGGGTGNATPVFATVRLSNTIHDSGFTMFHEPTGSNIACMSCHPEGGEDGHTWHFDLGFRRTQSIRGGIMSTAPFHWSGDEANMIQLSHDVFSERMGGGTMTDAQTNVLGNWVNRIPAIPARGTLDVAAVARGQAVFAKADCASCHSGERFTSNENKDVGTGAKFQVPSLLGVAARAPYMHDGCAPSLMSRFTDTKCGGGDNHGKIAGLNAQDLSDLVSYVESL